MAVCSAGECCSTSSHILHIHQFPTFAVLPYLSACKTTCLGSGSCRALLQAHLHHFAISCTYWRILTTLQAAFISSTVHVPRPVCALQHMLQHVRQHAYHSSSRLRLHSRAGAPHGCVVREGVPRCAAVLGGILQYWISINTNYPRRTFIVIERRARLPDTAAQPCRVAHLQLALPSMR